jgi:hypothetical protein
MADAAAAITPFEGDLLEEPLQGAPPEQEDSEDEDPRLGTVAGLVSKSDYAQAARTAEELLRDGVRDVRIIGPYLFGSFVEQGLKAMPRIFHSASLCLTESWEAFGPREKKTVLANNGLRWLFKTLSRHLLHHERLKDEEWKRWREPSNRAPIEEAIPLGESLMDVCAKTLPDGDSRQAIRPLLSWLQEHLRAVPAEVPQEKEPPLAVVPEPEEELDEEPEAQESAPAPQPRPMAARASTPASAPGLPISPAMELLLRKLQAFDVLVGQQDFLKAGIVAADVLGTIERFDPRVYLPTIFARFFSGLSSHAETLEPMLHNTESLSFRSLDQLYRVDLDAFLAQQSQAPVEE